MRQLTENEFREIVEIGLDRELDDFDVNANLFDDYGMESMGIVVMIVEIQRRTGVKIPDETIPKLLTAHQYLNYLDHERTTIISS